MELDVAFNAVDAGLETPAAYIRKGEQLPGSLFVSEGKVGTFLIKELPEGLLCKIPILRTMFSEYTHFKVVTGRFELVGIGARGNGKILDVLTESKPAISIPSPSTAVFPSTSFFSVSSKAHSVLTEPSKKSDVSVSSKPSSFSEPSPSHKPSPSTWPSPSPSPSPSLSPSPYPSPSPLPSPSPSPSPLLQSSKLSVSLYPSLSTLSSRGRQASMFKGLAYLCLLCIRVGF